MRVIFEQLPMTLYVTYLIFLPAVISTLLISIMGLQRNLLSLRLGNPVFWLAVSTFVGTFGQALYVLLYPDKLHEYKFVAGYNQSDIAIYLSLIPIGILFWSVGFLQTKARLDISKSRIFASSYVWSTRRVLLLNFIIVLTTVLSVYGFIRYVISEGSLLELAFRKIEVEVAEDTYSSLGHFRWLTFPSVVLAFINFLQYSNTSSRSLKYTYLFLTGVHLALYAVIPVISSVRTPVLYALLGVLIIHSIKNMVSWKRMMVAGSFLLIILVCLGHLRKLSQEGRISEFSLSEASATFLDSTIGSSNGLPLFASAIIAKYGPTKLGLQHGFTYIAALTGFVPRVLWANKPDISPEAEILDKIYEIPARRSGRPPGFVGEAVLNFGLIGLVPISLLLGILHRFYINSFLPLLRKQNSAACVMYASGMLYLFVNVWQLSFGLGFVSFTIGTFCSVILLQFVTVHTSQSSV